MPLTKELVEQITERYSRERDRYRKLTRVVEELCVSHFIESSGVLANITARTKSPISLRRKLVRIMRKNEKPHWDTAEDVFRELSDLSGVRIALYSRTDQELVEAGLSEKLFSIAADPKFDLKDKRAGSSPDYPGYKATHCQVELRPENLAGENENLEGLSCEIQICTMMQHVWNEIEHDIGYKPSGTVSTGENELLKRLSELAREGDDLIGELIKQHNKRLAQDNLIADGNSLANYIGELFHIERITFRENIGNLFEALQRINACGRKELRKVMGLKKSGDPGARKAWEKAKAEIPRFNTFLRGEGKDNYQLVARNSADPGLFLLLQHSRKTILQACRGPGRPAKIRSLATLYEQYANSTRKRRGRRPATTKKPRTDTSPLATDVS